MTVTCIFDIPCIWRTHGSLHNGPLRYAAAAAQTPNMAVGVRLAGADPAGAASAPSGVRDGMHMQHHQPAAATSREGPGGSR